MVVFLCPLFFIFVLHPARIAGFKWFCRSHLLRNIVVVVVVVVVVGGGGGGGDDEMMIMIMMMMMMVMITLYSGVGAGESMFVGGRRREGFISSLSLT